MKKIITSAMLISLLSAGLVMNNQGLEVRDVLKENYTNEVSGRLVKRKANEVANNNVSNVKAQISSVTENGTRHIRFVAALDSYLYDDIYFTISANNGSETKTLVESERINRAYTHIQVKDNVLSASDAFGEGYNYLIAYTINNVPESAWGYTFTASVTAKAEGYNESVSKSADRIINNMIEEEMEKVDPEVTISIENGATIVMGKDAAPIATVTEGLNYVTYYEQNEVKVSDTLPITPGTYSFIVEVEGNNLYNSVRLWRWFRLVEPEPEKVNPTFEFNFKNGDSFVKGADVKPECVVSEGADYEVYYYCEEKDLAGEVSTFATYEELEPGYSYSLNVKVKENDKYNKGSDWRWFRLLSPAVVEKVDPKVTISIENGATIVMGKDAAPIATVTEGLNYVTYYEQDEKKVSDTLPTTPGTYSFIVEVEGNDQYNSLRVWRWFRLEAPSTKLEAEITFNYKAGTTFYIGSDERPTVTVSEGADYIIKYESETGYNSTEFPTEAGTYSLVVYVQENVIYKASKQWLWFRVAA